MDRIALFNSVIDHAAVFGLPAVFALLVYRQIVRVARQRDDAEAQRAFEAGRAQGYKEGFVAGAEWRADGGPYR